MDFSLYIGLRYLKAKKSHNIINVISLISVIGICITTAALIIVLSVFNGFESVVSGMYSTFDPDIRITASKGKYFYKDSIDYEKIRGVAGVATVTDVIEDNALIKNESNQIIAAIKGVSKDFVEDEDIQSMIYAGQYQALLRNRGIIGYELAYRIGLPINNLPQQINILVPKRNAANLLNPAKAFNSHNININAVYSIQQEIDSKYVIVPIDIAAKLLEYNNNEITSIEIRLADDANMKKVQKNIKAILGDNYDVKNHFEIQDTLYKLMRSEKVAVYLILSLILLIAAFNLIGTLSMLIIDKEKDNAILRSMGATTGTIKKIYYFESLLMTAIGALSGLFIGLLVCLLQIKFEIIKFAQSGSFVIDAYPVQLLLSDFILIFITVIIIGTTTALIPISRLTISNNYNRK